MNPCQRASPSGRDCAFSPVQSALYSSPTMNGTEQNLYSDYYARLIYFTAIFLINCEYINLLLNVFKVFSALLSFGYGKSLYCFDLADLKLSSI